MKNYDIINYCITNAALQDSLLQSYRQIFLTIESIFLAVGTGLLIVMLTLSNVLNLLLLFVIFLTLMGFGIYFMHLIKRVIIGRGRDVSRWHCMLIEVEQKLRLSERLFTKFKILQRVRRAVLSDSIIHKILDDKHLDKTDLRNLQRHELDDVGEMWNKIQKGDTLSRDEIEKLVEKGLGHTREVMELMIPRNILRVWIILCLCGITLLMTNSIL